MASNKLNATMLTSTLEPPRGDSMRRWLKTSGGRWGKRGKSKEVGCVAMLITGRIERESECPRTAIERV